MCGIVGYLGESKSASFLIEKLRMLEYRGYDSSGIANLVGGGFVVNKAVGNISKLEEKLGDSMEISCAIAHTRWATHGKPTEVNAHPHISSNGEWAVVHNGIIENYLEIKAGLKNGSRIQSDTDTAVAAELLTERSVGNIDEFIDACDELRGSYAFVAMNTGVEDTLFLARNKSPLYCACNCGEALIASDPICFSGFCDKYYALNNNEFAVVKKTGIEFYNQMHQKVQKEQVVLDEVFEGAGKGDYAHFMLKEIMEERTALGRIVKSYSSNNVLEKFDKDFFEKYNRVEFIGCGTAYHAGLMGARYIEKCVKIPASCSIASEFIYKDPLVSTDTLYVFVSQSGETADTLRAMELVQSKGCTTIAVTNVLYSSLAKAVDYVLPVCAGPEIAVASTKAYVCQLGILYMFARRLEELKYGVDIDYIKDIQAVEALILDFDVEQLDQIATELQSHKDCFYIGKDLDYVTASEASLKLKEISYIQANSYPSGELKHGFLALVDEGTFIFVLANHKAINAKTYNAANEAVSRGAKAVLIGSQVVAENFYPAYHIQMPELDELLLPMVSIVPLQYLAYLVSVKKGINPDQPRNLAKSVTVE